MEKPEDDQLEIKALDLECISSINIDDFIRDYSIIDLSGAAGTTTMNSTSIPSVTINNGSGGNYQGLYAPPLTAANPSFSYNIPQPSFTSINPGLHVSGDAEFQGNIKWKGKDLGQLLENIEKRLKILVPDPAKLEHFEALKKAYDHYKTLEALCELPTEEPDQ
jgi:hypothetical protein